MSRVRRSDIVPVGPHRLRVDVRGEPGGRPPLLLVMGLGGNLEMWQPLREALTAYGDRQTIAFDGPGTGGSSTPTRPLRMRGLARVATGLLDALGVAGPVDVLGVSLGGAIAQQIALSSPERVRRLVLCATMPGVGGVPGDPRALRILATPRRYFDRAYLERVAATLYGGRIRREPDLFRQQAHARLSRPPSLRGYAYQLWAVSGWTSLPFLRRIQAETLVLAGDDDPIVPLTNGRILAARIPRARLSVVEGGGHLFLLDSTDVVAPRIAGFLDEPGQVSGTARSRADASR